MTEKIALTEDEIMLRCQTGDRKRSSWQKSTRICSMAQPI